MTKVVVTGAAGFIGSHLTEKLLDDGYDVVGIDCFSDYYPRQYKENNVAVARNHSHLKFLEADLLTMDLVTVFKDCDVVFHLAAQAGVRASWGESFRVYTDNNVLATQQVLEAVRDAHVRRLVFASSSSVYGDVDAFPMKESTPPKPVSPYGVTKLACEHLCSLYEKNYGVESAGLRYFTVYGPRQRPDMAFHIFGRALLMGETPVFFGNGEQTRDFTFVSDAVAATFAAGFAPDAAGNVYNIGGGSRVTLNDVYARLQTIVGSQVEPERQAPKKGDVRHTAADTTLAAKFLGYAPKVALQEGLEREMEWLKEVYLNNTGRR